jgi:DNA-binding MarR family transcriptional regulator
VIGAELDPGERQVDLDMGTRHVKAEARADAADARFDALLARLSSTTELWQDFLAAHRTIIERLSAQMMADHSLPLEWFDVLIHLADVPDHRLRQKELKDRLLLSESGVSRMLVRIEKTGFVTRTQADDDRRGVEIALTAKGKQALTEALESHLTLVAELFTERLTASDRAALRRALAKLED